MKSFLFVLIALLSLSCSSFAAKDQDAAKDYIFKFDPKDKPELKNKIFEVKVSAPSYEDAFQAAADKCFKFYKGPGHVSENRGLDIIDTCANPLSSPRS